MSRMSELIYPDVPGFKISGPPEQAAKAVTGTANEMREAVLARVAQCPGGATADEIAKDLCLSVLNVRSIVSELNRTGEIEQAGVRRKNDSCMTTTFWRSRSQPSPPIRGE
jgi:FaeA-like protein